MELDISPKPRIQRGCLQELGLVAKELGCERVLVVSDSRVASFYAGQAREILEGEGIASQLFSFPPGEDMKCFSAYLALLRTMENFHLTRTDGVVALGGGVIGDLTGFAASCFCRGISFLQVPTSLLAMVDSSLGGKNGINFEGKKNRLGTVYQPAAVLCDPGFLFTLPEKEWLNGIGEMLKMGLLFDEPLFDTLARGNWREQTESLVARCAREKLRIVREDPMDFGLRHLLNLGHTFAHGMEEAEGFHLPHGCCVGIGLLCAARLSLHLGLCGKDLPGRVEQALQQNGLPVRHGLDARKVARLALGDKKRSGDRLTLVLPRRVGECQMITEKTDKAEEWLRIGLEES